MNNMKWLVAALVGFGLAGCEAMSPSDPGNLVPRTVLDDPTLPAIELNGTRLHAETMGDPANPVIVFLHGGPGGDYRSMLRLANRYDGYSLTDDYFLVYWDQRGSGLSARVDKSELTIEKFIDDLNAVVNRYSPGRPAYLVGVSWGGMYATKYINDFPHRVAGAVLIEPGPLDGVTFERIKDRLNPIHLRDEWLNDIVWNSQFLTPDDHARMDFGRMLGVKNAQPANHTDNTNPEAAWRMGAAANKYLTESAQDKRGKFDFDFTTNLATYRTPVLFVTGSRSEVLGESLQRTQTRKYPSAALVVVDGAGHDVAWVKTSRVVSHVRHYLDARRGGAR